MAIEVAGKSTSVKVWVKGFCPRLHLKQMESHEGAEPQVVTQQHRVFWEVLYKNFPLFLGCVSGLMSPKGRKQRPLKI
jgi:hypothetical protein